MGEGRNVMRPQDEMSARFYFNLHGVGVPHEGVDDDERPYWLTPERLSEVLALVGKHYPDVGVTFDDGNISDLAIALPLLKREGVRAYFFIPVDRIGTQHYLTADEIRTLHKEGMIIGSHGCNHVEWPTLSDDVLEDEIARPLRVLADIIGAPVKSVGVPFGAYDGRVLQRLRVHGIEQVFTSDGGPCVARAWLLPRNSVRSDMPLTQVEAMLTRPRDPALFYLRAAKRVGRRVLNQLVSSR